MIISKFACLSNMIYWNGRYLCLYVEVQLPKQNLVSLLYTEKTWILNGEQYCIPPK